MRLKKSKKINKTPSDAKAFVREFIKKYSVKESEAYGKNANHSVGFGNGSNHLIIVWVLILKMVFIHYFSSEL